jgi:hypothetical protein
MDLTHLAKRLASLAGVIYLEEKLNLTQNFINVNDSDAMLAVKQSLMLSVNSYIGDMALERLGYDREASQQSWAFDFLNMGSNFLSNTLVFYVMDYAKLDEKIVPPGLSDEMRAARLAGLFLVVEVVTNHYVLKLFNQFYGGGSSSSRLY